MVFVPLCRVTGTSLHSPCQSPLQSVQLGKVFLQKFGTRTEKEGALVVHPGSCIISLNKHTHTHYKSDFTLDLPAAAELCIRSRSFWAGFKSAWPGSKSQHDTVSASSLCEVQLHSCCACFHDLSETEGGEWSPSMGWHKWTCGLDSNRWMGPTRPISQGQLLVSL